MSPPEALVSVVIAQIVASLKISGSLAATNHDRRPDAT